ncbi:MAG: glycoside hydrolase family 88 protein [Phycisphaerae bacterium]|nr:glycoside hydrolase family 88 protein [Phycisphaerae bacterium]
MCRLLWLVTIIGMLPCSAETLVQDNLQVTKQLLMRQVQVLGDTDKHPRTIAPDGQLKLATPSSWTSGFFPGCLWYEFQATQDPQWLALARKYTASVEGEKLNGKTHDMGFKMYCSFGNGVRLTHDAAYRDILLKSAETLCTRFNPAVGCLRSWDHNADKWDFPVIIDNMMNLELLFWAARESGDKRFFTIAVSHADTTLKNHFRSDHSTWHVIDYNPDTGAVQKRNTHQGYSHDSSWSRGQAWGLYGYTMCYRETGYTRYLDQARKIADFILTHPRLPEDKVPYWDFDAPDIPNEERDSAAGAITCSALYELSTLDSDHGATYRQAADTLLQSLSGPRYRAAPGENHNFILKHATGNKPGNSEVDVPLIYADYYFLEANLRKQAMDEHPGQGNGM